MFRRRLINRTENDVISSVGFSLHRLVHGMDGDPEEPMNADQAARHGHRQTVAAEMYADSFKRERNIEPVIDQQLTAVRGCKPLNLVCKSKQIPCTEVAFP